MNKMILSTQRGIEQAINPYILKIRSDIILKNTKFIKLFNKFSKFEDKFHIFKYKVIVSSLFTRRYIKYANEKINTPFHISDWISFGLKEDIQKLWSIELPNEPDFSQYFKSPIGKTRFVFNTRTWRFPPEQFIHYSLINREIPSIFMQSKVIDNIYNKIFMKILINNFIVIDPKNFRFYVAKKILEDFSNEICKCDIVSWYGLIRQYDYTKLYNKKFNKLSYVLMFDYQKIKRLYYVLMSALKNKTKKILNTIKKYITLNECRNEKHFYKKMNKQQRLIAKKVLNNPIDIENEFFNSDKYIVDRRMIDLNNDYLDWYSPFFKSNPHSFRLGYEKLEAAVIWGPREPQIKSEIIEEAIKRDAPVMFMETGFILSVGSHATTNIDMKYRKGVSITCDDLAFYFDATKASRLEMMLNSDLKLTNEQIKEAQKCIKFLVDNNITKYNYQPLSFSLPKTKKKKVLVIDQTANDASILLGMANGSSFNKMLRAAIKENKNAEIYVKIHPDTIANKNIKANILDSKQSNVHIITENANPISIIKQVDKVYCVTTQMGFEAVLCGKEVHCFGMPFYAGWGITHDRKKCFRRNKKRTIEEVFYITYILYCKYINPETLNRISCYDAMKYILQTRNEYFNGNRSTE